MKILRFGAIDIGSNAMRLLLMNIIENGSTPLFKKISLVRVPIRLGKEAFIDKKISDAKKERLADAVAGFRHLIEATDVLDFRACATSAMREADNGREVADYIREKSGIEVEIIDGKTEADIIYSTQITDFLNKKNSYLYVDVGGGSTELTLFHKNQVVTSASFNIGTVRILEDLVKKKDWKKMKKWIKKNTADYPSLYLIGSGGNINKIFKLSSSKRKKNPSLSYEQVRQIHNYLSAMDYEQRVRELGLKPDRADVIIPAGHIFLKILDWSKSKRIYVPKIGLADGMIHLLYEKHKAKLEEKEVVSQ